MTPGGSLCKGLWLPLVLLCLLFGGRAAAQGGLYVDAAQQLGTINPHIYGANHGPWAVVPFDLLPQAETAGIRFLRFPGGNWGDLNNITPRQIDDFIALCRRMNAEPNITVRLENGTPEAAAELVRYTNLEQGYAVRYWSIGNEPNLFDNYDSAQFNADWRIFAQAMRAVDPTILLIGPEISQYPPTNTPKDSAGVDWMESFLRANGDLVDIVSIHRYPFPTRQGNVTSIDDLRQNSPEWDIIIPNLRGVIQRITGRALPIAVTEVNSHWNNTAFGEASPDSFYNAIWYADVLGRLITQRVEIVAYFTLQTHIQSGGYGLLAAYDVRPTYYVFQLYQRFGQNLLFASSAEPDVSIYAAQRDDGSLTLMIINRADEEKSPTLTLGNFTPGGMVETWRFDAQHKAEALPAQPFDPAITLPAQSISLLIIGSQTP